MLRDSIDALVNRDAALAQRICARDSEVNRMKKEIRRQAEELLRSQPHRVSVWLALLGVARNLERIADHAVTSPRTWSTSSKAASRGTRSRASHRPESPVDRLANFGRPPTGICQQSPGVSQDLGDL